jgi:hypothetical protein
MMTRSSVIAPRIFCEFVGVSAGGFSEFSP